jgi:hypothetical protein
VAYELCTELQQLFTLARGGADFIRRLHPFEALHIAEIQLHDREIHNRSAFPGKMSIGPRGLTYGAYRLLLLGRDKAFRSED